MMKKSTDNLSGEVSAFSYTDKKLILMDISIRKYIKGL